MKVRATGLRGANPRILFFLSRGVFFFAQPGSTFTDLQDKVENTAEKMARRSFGTGGVRTVRAQRMCARWSVRDCFVDVVGKLSPSLFLSFSCSTLFSEYKRRWGENKAPNKSFNFLTRPLSGPHRKKYCIGASFFTRVRSITEGHAPTFPEAPCVAQKNAMPTRDNRRFAQKSAGSLFALMMMSGLPPSPCLPRI